MINKDLGIDLGISNVELLRYFAYQSEFKKKHKFILR